MIMKKLFVPLILLALIFSASGFAKSKLRSTTFESMKVYYGQSKNSFGTSTYEVTVATPEGVYYGVYKAGIVGQHKGDVIPLVSWTGPGSVPAPTLTLVDWDSNIGNSHCPGIDGEYWQCASLTFKVTVASDDYGCPWVATVKNTTTLIGESQGSQSYTGPVSRGSACPTVPVSTYDVSWSPDSVQHGKTLSFAATGGTINSTLNTYLMESGTLCDGSKYDSRGAYCRFISTGVTLTVLGCSNASIVTTTATAHPITDKELHDINVAVNTKNVGSGATTVTCNFQYILEQL